MSSDSPDDPLKKLEAFLEQIAAMVTRPRAAWPDLEVQWDTLQVYCYDLSKVLHSHDVPRHRMSDLEPAARELLAAHLVRTAETDGIAGGRFHRSSEERSVHNPAVPGPNPDPASWNSE